MAVDDIELMAGGLPPVQLQIAEPGSGRCMAARLGSLKRGSLKV